MREVIEYLKQHPEVVEKVKNGQASLRGLSRIEQQAIVDIFNNKMESEMEVWT